MSWYNWLIVILPFAGVLYMAFHTRKYIRGISDFLVGGRVCGRYLLSVGMMEEAISVMALIAMIEINYRTGFAKGFWGGFTTPLYLKFASHSDPFARVGIVFLFVTVKHKIFAVFFYVAE